MTYPMQTGKTGQTITFTTSPKDDNGKSVPLDGSVPITFSVDKPGIVNVGINNNATLTGSITLISPGTVNITASATSAGVPLSEIIPVTVSADNATTFGFVFAPAA